MFKNLQKIEDQNNNENEKKITSISMENKFSIAYIDQLLILN